MSNARYIDIKFENGGAFLTATNVDGQPVPLTDLRGKIYRVDLISDLAMALVPADAPPAPATITLGRADAEHVLQTLLDYRTGRPMTCGQVTAAESALTAALATEDARDEK